MKDFVATLHQVARELGGEVVGVERYRGICTTFVRGSIQKRFGGTTDVLSHRDLPLFALAAHGTDTFVDDAELRAAWPHPLMTLEELNADSSRTSPEVLAITSVRDLRYWNPLTVGQVVFNYWD